MNKTTWTSCIHIIALAMAGCPQPAPYIKECPDWYLDEDLDGFAAPGPVYTADCDPPTYPEGVLLSEDEPRPALPDCDDHLAAVAPGLEEVCDGLDNNCDGSIDEIDADGDGYSACPDGALPAGDCDDDDPERHPRRTEVCDGIDQDCDDQVDEELLQTWFIDADGDGAGDPATAWQACEGDVGAVTEGTDCDDDAASTFPGATETCDGGDNDCDGAVDEVDEDGDGFVGCNQGPDCDDHDGAVFPGATEICNGTDDDCDDAADNGVTTTFYHDFDGDGFGDADAPLEACEQPAGYVTDRTDCDDRAVTVHPGAVETCDGLNQDCDEGVDEGLPVQDYYRDGDGDGFGNTLAVLRDCAQPQGYVPTGGDCNDAMGAIFPGADESCNRLDDDCDDAVDEVDGDGDGFVGCATGPDCDDNDAAIFPDAMETCDGVDHDCDGTVDDVDLDGDGFFGCGVDCDDANVTVFPGATETCNAVDDDCDHAVDEVDLDGDGSLGCDQGPDCNDALASVFPSAAEACNRLDDDCDGVVDEVDLDGDGFLGCDQGPDCDDARGAVSPNATESCNLVDDDCDGVVDEVDLDGDGFVGCATGPDCDDGDAQVNRSAAEVCDGRDQDCDGQTDEGVERRFYPDADGDGFGDGGAPIEACEAPEGYVPEGGDCDDRAATIHIGAAETCNGLDEDCDGRTDEGIPVQDYYQDSDGDGFGHTLASRRDCAQPEGYVPTGGDCNDGIGAIFPGASESCNLVDDDCDGAVDEVDLDGDGFVGCATGPDCDDSDAQVNRSAAEVCDGRDQDCDGQVDEGVEITFYQDLDGDGFGDADVSLEACEQPAGYVTDRRDCDDAVATAHPGAFETCDGRDEDCDRQIDNDVLTRSWYLDSDGDGFGTALAQLRDCAQPEGYVVTLGDCNDGIGAIFPGASESCNLTDDDCDGAVDEVDLDDDGFVGCATGPDCDDSDARVNRSAAEVCDGRDQDCDGQVDEGVESTFYADLDGDGFGDASVSVDACERPAGYVTDGRDCEDATATVHPGAFETCDGRDEDCDGRVDNDVLTRAWYLDSDGDGFGTALAQLRDCAQPEGYVVTLGDCNDGIGAIFPGASEACNLTDDDCDGAVDEVDLDGDGFVGCAAGPDCDDGDAQVNRSAAEVCDGRDQDCDGQTDEGVESMFYADLDGDGFGDADAPIEACVPPEGYVPNRADCDDTLASVYPGAPETCNGRDDDCDLDIDDGALTSFYFDNDDDGFGTAAVRISACEPPTEYVAIAGDCDDALTAVHPEAPELCNHRDDDCDGADDDGLALFTSYPDGDGDAVAREREGEALVDCEVPNGRAVAVDPDGDGVNDWDCDDSDGLSYPGATEVCGDNVDNTCSGIADQLCFRECEGSWPFSPPTTAEAIHVALLVDMDGDGIKEIVMQARSQLSLIAPDGTEIHRQTCNGQQCYYALNPVTFADLDAPSTNGMMETLELLSPGASQAHAIAKKIDLTTGAVSTTVSWSNARGYASGRLMARDLDRDGTVELVTTSYAGPVGSGVGHGSQILEITPPATGQTTYRFNLLSNIPDPEGLVAMQGTCGRTLTDLDGDGRSELLTGNGALWEPVQPYGHVWAHSLDETFQASPYCLDCFNTDISEFYTDLYSAGVRHLYRMGNEIVADVGYSRVGTNTFATFLSSRFDLEGAVSAPGRYGTSVAMTDLDRDGRPESTNVLESDLVDVNGDGVPDRVRSVALSDGTKRLRVELFSPATDTFVPLQTEGPEHAQTGGFLQEARPSTREIAAHRIHPGGRSTMRSLSSPSRRLSSAHALSNRVVISTSRGFR